MWYQLLLLPLIFAVPELRINWSAPEDSSITIQLQGDARESANCLRGGLELSYKFEARLCKRRPFWFDTCQDVRELTRKVSYDPISQTYSVDEFWSSDRANVVNTRYSSRRSMVRYVHTLAAVPLKFLSFRESEFVNSKRSYVSVRVRTDCRGEYNETLAAISQVLSLGQIEVSGFDTGWIDFRLRGDSAAR